MEKNLRSILQEKEVDILQLILYLGRDWKLISIITGLGIIIGLIIALISPPWYKAEVKIMPSMNQGNPILGQFSNIEALTGINLKGEMGGNYIFYPEIIKSNFILDRVLEHEFKNSTFKTPVTISHFLETEKDTTQTNWKYQYTEKAKKELRKYFINSFLNQETDLLIIQATVPKDPVLAEQLANFVADQLDIYNKHYRNYKAKDQKIFIEQSLKETKENVIKAETDLKEFLYQNKDLSSPQNKLEYDKLSNELNLQRGLYTELKKQLELAKIEEIKETETLNILDRAVVPIEKYKPKRVLILMIAAFISFSVAIIVIVLKNYLSAADFRHTPNAL